MPTLYQPRRRFLVAVLGLAVASGCQGGIGRFLPGGVPPSIPLVSGKDQKAPAAEAKVSAPAITPHNYAQVQLALGDAMSKEGNFEGAQAAYEAALRNDDTLGRAYHRLALVYEKTGRGSEAKDLLLKAIKLDPKNAEIVCDYGYWCYLRQDWNESKKQFQRALQLDPNLKRAHNNLGLVYARTKRPDDALKHFAAAGLSLADARANLAFVYLTEQRMPDAKIELERAVAATPSSEKAQKVLADLEKFEASAQSESVSPLASDSPAAPASIDQSSIPGIPPASEAPPQVATANQRANESPLEPANTEDAKPLTANSPAAPADRQFEHGPPLAAEQVPRVASTIRSVSEFPLTRQTNKQPLTELPASIERQFDLELPTAAEPAPAMAVESSTVNGFPLKRQTNMRDLPTQKLSPVLFNYPAWEAASKPASMIKPMEYADQLPATSKEEGTPSYNGEPPIRLLPPPAELPPGA